MLAEMEDRVQQLCATVASLVEERDALMEQLQVDEAILTGSMGSQVAPSESEMFLAAADQEQVRFGSLFLLSFASPFAHGLLKLGSNSAGQSDDGAFTRHRVGLCGTNWPNRPHDSPKQLGKVPQNGLQTA